MAKKENTIVNEILGTLMDMGGELVKVFPLPFETPYEHVRRMRGVGQKKYSDTVYNLKARGVVKVFNQNGEKFIQLTEKGQLELLLAKAKIEHDGKWDGKWRVLIFDIPEDARHKRDILRRLLIRNKFVKLQASVFVHPYPLNREAVTYLKETGLINYIRLMRVDDMDEDKDLRKKFHLPIHE